MGSRFSRSSSQEGEDAVGFPLHHYHREGQPCGSGSFGNVYKYRIKEAQAAAVTAKKPELIAVKQVTVLSADDKGLLEMLEREYNIMSTLPCHKNIVQFLGRKDEPGQGSSCEVNLVMELCDYDLGKLLQARRSFNVDEAATIVKELLKGLQHLHRRNIVHRDIKPQNVLIVTHQENPDWKTIKVEDLGIKIGDFGLAKICQNPGASSTIRMTVCGTRSYWAPEVRRAYEEQRTTVGSQLNMDSYSIGVLTFRLVTGREPEEWERGRIANARENATLARQLGLEAGPLISFLRATMATEWRDRSPIGELLEHDFVKEAPSAMTQRQRLASQALWNASNEGNVQGIEAALEAEADLEWKNPDYYHRSPLSIASYRYKPSAVESLLSKGAEVNSRDDLGRTPLYWAAHHGHEQVLRILLDNNGDTELAESEGDVPLIAASGQGHLKCVEILLDKGADIKKTDNQGRSALDFAYINERHEILKILQDWMQR